MLQAPLRHVSEASAVRIGEPGGLAVSDSEKDANGVWGYVIVAVVSGAIVYSFTRPEEPAKAVPPAVSTIVSPPPVAPIVSATPSPISDPLTIPPPAPAHFYDAVEGSTYFYAAAVSEDERKSGKRAPDMLAFRYLGRDEDGKDRVQRVIRGTGQWVSTCARPCKVIHSSDGGMIAFDTGSIIGAVFSDAKNGFLKRYRPPQPPAPIPASPSSDSDYQYYDSEGNVVDASPPRDDPS